MVCLRKRFHVAVRLFSNRSQITWEKQTSGTRAAGECVTDDCIEHFDVFCNLLLNGRTAILSLFVLYNEQERENDILALCRLTVRGFMPV